MTTYERKKLFEAMEARKVEARRAADRAAMAPFIAPEPVVDSPEMLAALEAGRREDEALCNVLAAEKLARSDRRAFAAYDQNTSTPEL